METVILLPSGKSVNLSEFNCLLSLTPSEFEELLRIVHEIELIANAA